MAISPSCEREMLFLCCEMKEEHLCWKLKDWAFAIRDGYLSLLPLCCRTLLYLSATTDSCFVMVLQEMILG